MDECVGSEPPASGGGHQHQHQHQHQDDPASVIQVADGVVAPGDSTNAADDKLKADAQSTKELPETEAAHAQAQAPAGAAAEGGQTQSGRQPPTDLPIDAPAVAAAAPPALTTNADVDASIQFDDAGSQSKSKSKSKSTAAVVDPSPLVQTWAASIPHPLPPPPPSSEPRPTAAEPGLTAPTTPATPTTPAGASHTLGHDPSPLLPDIPHIVAPSSYLRQRALNRTAMAALPEQAQPQPPPQPSVFDKEQSQGLVSFPFAPVLAKLPPTCCRLSCALPVVAGWMVASFASPQLIQHREISASSSRSAPATMSSPCRSASLSWTMTSSSKRVSIS
jgi:hypothetical protein